MLKAKTIKIMKWKFNIRKEIITPIEVEADNWTSAVEKVNDLIPQIDTDHGEISYCVDTTPSSSQIKWRDI